MSRVEENGNMRQNTKIAFHGKPDDVLCQIKGQELGILLDISKSLAIIADAQLEYLHSETEPPIFKENNVDQFNDKYGRKTDENLG